MYTTKNFNPETDIKLACTCGHAKCDKRLLKDECLDQLQKIRDDFGRGIKVTSGGRCQYHPNEIHKAKPADHQLCYAVDVYYGSEADRTKLEVLGGRHGCTRVAHGKNFVHLAWTPTDDKSVPTWSYY